MRLTTVLVAVAIALSPGTGVSQVVSQPDVRLTTLVAGARIRVLMLDGRTKHEGNLVGADSAVVQFVGHDSVQWTLPLASTERVEVWARPKTAGETMKPALIVMAIGGGLTALWASKTESGWRPVPILIGGGLTGLTALFTLIGSAHDDVWHAVYEHAPY